MKSTASESKGTTLGPYLNLLAILLVSVLGLVCLYFLRNPQRIATLGWLGLFTIGIVGTWRWSWFSLQVIRGRIYQHWVFPRWRRRANRVSLEQLPPICFLVPTYKEKPWITERVFRAIALEAKSLPHPTTVLVTSGSDAENAAILAVVKSIDPELRFIRLVTMVQTGEGKRKAMADGLRKLASLNLPPDTIVALMDGDSELTPGTLRRSLPFFRLFPKMGALTTDELPVVKGSYLFSEWFHLRQAQRNYHMCSVSLSQKVTCLTGRFSLFRSEAAFDPTFADILENDVIDDWLWGRFKFLSGDDKSTWYWLLRRGYDMIYLPDVIIYSIETISGSLINRAYQNMRRWYGNMLRNSNRAIALGPKKTGWFMWFVLIDQKISVWIPIMTPGFLLLYLLQAKWIAAGLIASWVLLTRPLMLMIYFINFSGRESHLKPIHLPLLLVSQWSACLVKIWTQVNLAQQRWANRGNQSISAEGTGVVRLVKLSTSRFLYFSGLFGFGIILCWLAGNLNPTQALAGLWWESQIMVQNPPAQVIEAINHGIIPDDNQDDSVPLQALINRLSNQGQVEINLPIGEIDLFHPLEINRNHTILKGQGIGRTIMQAHFNQEVGQAVLTVRPREQQMRKDKTQSSDAQQDQKNWVEDVGLRGFTLRQIPSSLVNSTTLVDSIVLEKVVQASVENLDIEKSSGHSLVLRKTQNVKVEYVGMDDKLVDANTPS